MFKIINAIICLTMTMLIFGCGRDISSTAALLTDPFEYSGAVGSTAIEIQAGATLSNTEMTPLNGGVIIAWQSDKPTRAHVYIRYSPTFYEELSLEVKPGKAAIVVTKDRQVLRAGNVEGHRVFKCDGGGSLCMSAIPLIQGMPPY